MAQCANKKSNGKRCRAQALTGRKTCLFHSKGKRKSRK
jgi:hypothetical protein